MRNTAPAHIGDMKKTVEAADVDEHAEIGDVLHLAVDNLADLELVELLGPRLLATLLKQVLARHDHILALVVDLHDQELALETDKRILVTDGTDIHERGREERFHADIDHETAANLAGDAAFHNRAFFGVRKNLVPGLLAVRLPFGKKGRPFTIVKTFEKHFYLLPDGKGRGVQELIQGKDAF